MTSALNQMSSQREKEEEKEKKKKRGSLSFIYLFVCRLRDVFFEAIDDRKFRLFVLLRM